jgi:hypothetical protein
MSGRRNSPDNHGHDGNEDYGDYGHDGNGDYGDRGGGGGSSSGDELARLARTATVAMHA